MSVNFNQIAPIAATLFTAGGLIFQIGMHSEKLSTLGFIVNALEKKEEYELITKWQNDNDQKSLLRLIGAYNKLINSIAKKYSSYGLSHFDLMQEGTIGFMHALEKFDLFILIFKE